MTEEEAKKEIIDMANALQLIPNTPKGKAVSMALKALEQEPCEDAISRERLKEVFHKNIVNGSVYDDLIDAQPPVYPQPKTGHWEEYGHNISDSYIWDGVRCSLCKKDARVKTRFIKHEPILWDRDCFELTNYCPNCGTKMEVEDA